MTTEEKARKYEDALANARQEYNTTKNVERKQWLEELFPELAESKDEKNIKNLIDELKCSLRAANCQNEACNGGHEKRIALLEWAIAWLEKQGRKESDPRYENLEELLAADDIYQMAMNDAMVQEAKKKALNALSGMCIGRLLGLEKQGEQKPVEWSEDDEQYLLVCKNALEKYEVSDKWDSTIIMQWLKEKLKKPVKPNFRERYKRISDSEWFKRTHEGMSVSEEKIETKPKFKVGDWITDGYLHCKISDVLEDRYIVDTKFAKRSAIPFKCENNYHLWSIEDAKDGDVLAVDSMPFIYNGSKNEVTVGAYCGFNTKHRFSFAYNYVINQNITPATKEQCDLLFAKMKDAGYEWDEEKKELNKIEQNSAWGEEDEAKKYYADIKCIDCLKSLKEKWEDKV